MRKAATALALIALATPAQAKEGMTATLTKKVDVQAPAGSTVRIVWRLQTDGATSAAQGDRFYVRLTSRSGARPTRAWGIPHGRQYAARVKVPRGGIHEIQVWLVGYRITAESTTRADVQVPITNPPLTNLG